MSLMLLRHIRKVSGESRKRPVIAFFDYADVYEDFYSHYGIDPDTTPVRLSWEGMKVECSKLIEDGKSLPPGMSNPKAQFSCKFTRSTKRAE